MDTKYVDTQCCISHVIHHIFFILCSNVHMYCEHCQGNSVNWNEQFSVSAFCEDCGLNAKSVTYYWKLYLVNASIKAVPESKYTVLKIKVLHWH